MEGSVADRALLHGGITMNHPGFPTDAERADAAARLPQLEAGRHKEIAHLSEMWSDGASGPMGMGGLQRMRAAALLKEEHGIDMEAIHKAEDKKRADERNTPQARMQRETARQVQLSNAIQARAAAAESPMAMPMGKAVMDARVSEILGHYGD